MPITLQPLSRRHFLAGALAGGVSLALSKFALADAPRVIDQSRFALLSDVHIAGNPAEKNRGVVMADHLRQALGEVLGPGMLPSHVFINGDCAYLKGLGPDYATLVDLLKPVRQMGLPIHLAMGNHDWREHFWSALPADDARACELADREVLSLTTPRARWIMLDSLEKTNSTPGILGARQLEWLTHALDADKDKPTIVMVHHNPHLVHADTEPSAVAATTHSAVTGLKDAAALFDVLLPRKQVKALFFGHTHVWSVSQVQGLHLVNLPAVAYVFSPEQPSGWVDAELNDSGMRLTLNALNPEHPWNRQTHDLAWR